MFAKPQFMYLWRKSTFPQGVGSSKSIIFLRGFDRFIKIFHALASPPLGVRKGNQVCAFGLHDNSDGIYFRIVSVSFPYRFRIVSVSFPYHSPIILLSFSYRSPIILLLGSGKQYGNNTESNEERTENERKIKGDVTTTHRY